MWYVRTRQWKGNWINRHENKIEIKNFNFKFWIQFNISITVSLRKVIKESCIYLN